MQVINLFGAPGTGKSATMLALGSRLKRMGLSCEITPEYFKELIQEVTPDVFRKLIAGDDGNGSSGASMRFGGQLQVLAEQNRRLAMHMGSADFVISDCPLPLIAFYTSRDFIPGFHEMADNLFHCYENTNYLVVPSQSMEHRHDFEGANRIHDSQASNMVQQGLIDFLSQHRIDYTVVEADDDIEGNIIMDMMERGVISQEHLENSRNPMVRESSKQQMAAVERIQQMS